MGTIRWNAELGEAEKRCGKCGEYLPMTREYWIYKGDQPGSPCKACQQERRLAINQAKPCCVPGCNKPRHISSSGQARYSRCIEHQQALNQKAIARERQRKEARLPELKEVREMGDIKLLKPQESALKKLARLSQETQSEWVDSAGIDPRPLRALVKQHLIDLDEQTRTTRYARVTQRGWRYLGEVSPEFDEAPEPDDTPAAPEPAPAPVEDDGERMGAMMRASAPTNGHGGERKVFRGPYPPGAPHPTPLMHQPGDPRPPLTPAAPEAHSGDCKGCVYREAIEILGASNQQIYELVEAIIAVREVRAKLNV